MKKKIAQKGNTMRTTEKKRKRIESLITLVDKVGNDTPTKKPKTTPTNVVTISLMVSFGFLLTAQQPRRSKC